MKRHTCLPRRGRALCQECGTSINTEDVDFTRQEKNLVYMDKVYSFEQGTSCPLLSGFVSNPGNSVIELKLEGDARRRNRCGCGGRGCDRCREVCILDEDAVFTIDTSHVLVESFSLANPTCLSAEQVSVDGVFVDSLVYNNGQFTAATNNLLPEILKDRCQDLGLPTKAFFLISDAGPWVYKATFVLEGTVNSNGRTCCFQVKVKTTECGAPRAVSGCSNFGIQNISLPCSVNGTAPVINFQFTGAVHLLNPELSFVCGGGRCGILLETNLVVEPQVNVEVVRRTLFCVDACEGLLPCDGTEQKFITEEEEDCTWPPPPACRCGTATSPMQDECLKDRRIFCNFDDDDDDFCDCRRGRRMPIVDDTAVCSDRFDGEDVAGCGCEPIGCDCNDGCYGPYFGHSKMRGCNGCAW